MRMASTRARCRWAWARARGALNQRSSPRRARQAAVEGQRRLGDHPRPAGDDPAVEGAVEPSAFLFQHTLRAPPRPPLPTGADRRPRVADSGSVAPTTTRPTRAQDRLRAGRRAPVGGTRLQGDVDRRPRASAPARLSARSASISACGCPAARWYPRASTRPPAHDHRADRRVRAGVARRLSPPRAGRAACSVRPRAASASGDRRARASLR